MAYVIRRESDIGFVYVSRVDDNTTRFDWRAKSPCEAVQFNTAEEAFKMLNARNHEMRKYDERPGVVVECTLWPQETVVC